MSLTQFLSYFGAKSRNAHLYPQPKYDIVVEPFAGGAGYSLYHHTHNVVLIEKQSFVFDIWDWLINKATKDEILSIPLEITDLREMDLPEIHKKFLGFMISPNVDHPIHKPRPAKLRNGDSCSHWTSSKRTTISKQLKHIKHWRVFNGNFSTASDIVKEKATWFIDPPYQLDRHSAAYRPHSSKTIDFYALGDWCQSLPGQTIVCEQHGADWLPFKSLAKYIKGTGLKRPKSAHEVIWLSDGSYRKVASGFNLGGT